MRRSVKGAEVVQLVYSTFSVSVDEVCHSDDDVKWRQTDGGDDRQRPVGQRIRCDHDVRQTDVRR